MQQETRPLIGGLGKMGRPLNCPPGGASDSCPRRQGVPSPFSCFWPIARQAYLRVEARARKSSSASCSSIKTPINLKPQERDRRGAGTHIDDLGEPKKPSIASSKTSKSLARSRRTSANLEFPPRGPFRHRISSGRTTSATRNFSRNVPLDGAFTLFPLPTLYSI